MGDDGKTCALDPLTTWCSSLINDFDSTLRSDPVPGLNMHTDAGAPDTHGRVCDTENMTSKQWPWSWRRQFSS